MNDLTSDLLEDMFEGVMHGNVGASLDAIRISRREEGEVLEIDTGDPHVVYLVTVSRVERTP